MTQAWREAGFRTMPPMETFVSGSAHRNDHDLSRVWVLRRELERASRGWYAWAHFVPPAGTFGPLYLAGNSGTRTSLRPQGDGSKTNEVHANALWGATVRIARRVAEFGGGVSVEVPASCLAVELPEWKIMVEAHRMFPVQVDLCAFGLAPPDSSPAEPLAYRKRVQLWTNMPQLRDVARACPGGHRHLHAQGAVRVAGRSHRRSTLADVGPPAFCNAVVQAFTSSAESEPPPARPPGDTGG